MKPYAIIGNKLNKIRPNVSEASITSPNEATTIYCDVIETNNYMIHSAVENT